MSAQFAKCKTDDERIKIIEDFIEKAGLTHGELEQLARIKIRYYPGMRFARAFFKNSKDAKIAKKIVRKANINLNFGNKTDNDISEEVAVFLKAAAHYENVYYQIKVEETSNIIKYFQKIRKDVTDSNPEQFFEDLNHQKCSPEQKQQLLRGNFTAGKSKVEYHPNGKIRSIETIYSSHPRIAEMISYHKDGLTPKLLKKYNPDKDTFSILVFDKNGTLIIDK